MIDEQELAQISSMSELRRRRREIEQSAAQCRTQLERRRQQLVARFSLTADTYNTYIK